MLKRLFDFSVSSISLVILSPVIFILYLLIKANLGSPVIFRQTRPGLHERPFELLKFRTMTDSTGIDGSLLPDIERLTSFGKLLRATSLDELPELVNIICGEMSLVGPRPLLTRYLPYYSDAERRRHDVLPGLTGLAQISGRNALTWEEKLGLDIKYVESRNFLLDIKIILLTVKKVFLREDVLHSAPQGSLDSYRERLNRERIYENSATRDQ